MPSSRPIPIGWFSRITGISVNALRFYDEQGVLHPAEVDPRSHYRLYGLGQLDVAATIRHLRELGVPLDEVKATLEAGDEEIMRVLEMHRERLKRRQSEIEQTVAGLEALMLRGRHALRYDIELCAVPPLRVISARTQRTVTELVGAQRELSSRLRSALRTSNAACSPREIFLYHDLLHPEQIDFEVCVPVPDAVTSADDAWTLPGGTALRTVHYGTWDDIWGAYAAVLSWAAHNQREVEGPLREVNVVDDRDTPKSTEYVTELTWLLQ